MIFEAIYSIQTLSLSLCAQYLEGICKELFTAKSRGGLVVLFIYPETKGQTLESMGQHLGLH